MAGGVHLMWPSWNRCALVRWVTAKSPSALGTGGQGDRGTEGHGERMLSNEEMREGVPAGVGAASHSIMRMAGCDGI